MISGGINSPFFQKVKLAVSDPKNKKMLCQLFPMDFSPAYTEVQTKLMNKSSEVAQVMVKTFDNLEFGVGNLMEANQPKLKTGSSEWNELTDYFKAEQDLQCRLTFAALLGSFGFSEKHQLRKYEIGSYGEYPLLSKEKNKEIDLKYWGSSKMLKIFSDTNLWNIKDHRIVKLIKAAAQLLACDPKGVSGMNKSVEYDTQILNSCHVYSLNSDEISILKVILTKSHLM